ncbi:serine hydrolase domain-containing protein [Novosphingobium sp. MBES04]|uniref:serine hydrolase domain-containing protein n=1 Tax=Novosphingobium sp. MBES04 TaxID=1206458 RepID=UPI00057DC1FC|nr:serine hydrolase domain-containing protein [Novosphingobium sp. MBES04]GAM05182.1 beta-lactamase [Novosphingobium sp. MBES04]
MKRSFASLALPTLLPALLAGCAASPVSRTPAHADTALSEAEAEALYQERFARYMRREPGAGLAGYDTLAPVEGTADWTPFPNGGGVAPDALAAARAYAAQANSSAFLVWQGGHMVSEDYFGDTTATSPVVSKSLAKPLATIAVGRAMAAGHIASLDQPMSDFLTEWQDTLKAAITIRQVLGMRSGLLPQGSSTDPDSVLNRSYLHPFHDRVLIEDYPLVDTPGSRYEYSNANGDLVALLIERATGIPYEEWVGREVLAKIGARGGQIWMDHPGGTPHSGCCILLPAESYLRLAVLLAQDGTWEGARLLPEGFVTAMRRPSAQNPHAGLGVYVGAPYVEWRGPANPELTYGRSYHSEPYAADDLFLFDGNSNQVVYVVPSRQLVVLRTGDSPPKEPVWDNTVLPNLILRGLSAN